LTALDALDALDALAPIATPQVVPGLDRHDLLLLGLLMALVAGLALRRAQ
jgi:hypothetical protein